jgi:hypothetical protein
VFGQAAAQADIVSAVKAAAAARKAMAGPPLLHRAGATLAAAAWATTYPGSFLRLSL